MYINYRNDRQIRIREQLDNGQYATLYLTHYVADTGEWAWNVGFCVSNNKRIANDWYNEKKHVNSKMHNRSTGKVGITALLWCLHKLQEFEAHLKEQALMNDTYCIITVSYTNDQRNTVYSRLRKYGYAHTYFDNEYCYIKYINKRQ